MALLNYRRGESGRQARFRAGAYLLAPISVAGCIGLRYLVTPVLHGRGKLITFTLAVAVSAIAGGPGPGLLATGLGLIAGIFLFMHPPGEVFRDPDLALAMIFLINALVMCWLSRARDRAARAAESLNRELETRIAERSALAEQRASDLEASQRQLHEQASLLRSILDSIGDAVLVVDAAGQPIHRNPAATRLFGESALEQVELTWGSRRAPLPQVIREHPQAEDEVVVQRKNEKRWLTMDVRPLAGAAGHPNTGAAVAVFHDISQRKDADVQIRAYQQQLRSLASELTLAEQRERRRIAVELHDHIAHLLVMCKLKLSSLGARRESAGDSETFDQIKQALDEAIGYTRSLIFRLSPPVLYELGLEAAVEWLAAQFRTRHDLIVEVRDDKQPKPLGEDVRVALFQAVRELLFNVVKHGHSNRATVMLSRAENDIRVTVADTGSGFDLKLAAPDPSRPGGLGLFSIRERIDLLGGTVEIASAPGRGTRVTLTAPLAAPSIDTDLEKDEEDPSHAPTADEPSATTS